MTHDKDPELCGLLLQETAAAILVGPAEAKRGGAEY